MPENQYNVDSPLTFIYKEVDGIRVLLDVYLPPNDVDQQLTGQPIQYRPAVVYFHGGGLTVGNRQSWFPTWFKSCLHAVSYSSVQIIVLFLQGPDMMCSPM
jgi:acetyl esterase/lipase